MEELPDNVEKITDDFVEDFNDKKSGGNTHPRWYKHVALTTLIMALLTALAAMLVGITSDQSLFERTQEIIEANSMQADQIFLETLKSKHEILTALGEIPDQTEIEAITTLEEKIKKLDIHVTVDETFVLTSTQSYYFFSVSAAILSLGTALNGMSIIVDHKFLWSIGLVLGVIGVIGIVLGVLKLLI